MIAYHRRADGTVTQLSDDAALREALTDRDGLLWIDLLIREQSDATVLDDVFHFHPLSRPVWTRRRSTTMATISSS